MARPDTSDAQDPNLRIRPLYPRDLERPTAWGDASLSIEDPLESTHSQLAPSLRPWLAWWNHLGQIALPHHQNWSGFVAEMGETPCGLIEVSPFNRTRSTWRVDRVVVNPLVVPTSGEGPLDRIGSQLLRHCFENIWQARMWLAEVTVNHTSALALYRQNGFQPLAQVTYWEISSEILLEQAQREPDLPNLMPVSNADAQLLYQLDTAAMPPLVRQVFDQQIQDFKVEPLAGMTTNLVQRMQRIDCLRGYVFEPQRKAAIGRFELTVSCDGRRPHTAELTVHPAYTWLYPELISHMARVLQSYPTVSLRITSHDYQPEREDYLTQIQADPVERTLMMARSVWHKVRETKPAALEGLQLSDVLPGLQPLGKPMPGRMSWHSESWSDAWPGSWQGRSRWSKWGLGGPSSRSGPPSGPVDAPPDSPPGDR
ncbi:GNAT family N-acetyltransferase [Leptolyngbya sp. PCC 6406]|uniref:GNAT family N-acetyltransferase n=1 Tax=Leptolyngbya sp. PCC 6406 TaxID=1173264 RepID=UPI0002AC5E3B|nr:GNAT family N-acetyltransferase [Leptolyngbya sp. PCC 6406]